VKRPIHTLRGDAYFPSWLQLFVNRNAESFAYPLHDHDFVEFVYISEGKGFHHIADGVQPVRKGDFFVIPIGVSHVFRPTAPDPAGSPLVVYNCVASADLLLRLGRSAIDPDIAAYLVALADTGMSVVSGTDADGAVERLFLELHREFMLPGTGSADLLCALLLRLIVTLRRSTSAAASRSRDEAFPSEFSALLAYLDRNAHQELTLAELAAIGRWSERHLRRLFLRHTGQTYYRYLQNLRVRRGCELLRTTDWKVGVVAESVGYKDIDAFNATFKRTTGATPSEYRRRAKAFGPDAPSDKPE